MQLWNQSAQLAKLKQFVFNCCLCISAIYRVSRIISNHTVAVCLFRIPRNVWLYMNHCFIHGLYKYQISYRAAKRRFKKKCSKLVIRVLNIFSRELYWLHTANYHVQITQPFACFWEKRVFSSCTLRSSGTFSTPTKM